jgi:hypothetical protein
MLWAFASRSLFVELMLADVSTIPTVWLNYLLQVLSTKIWLHASNKAWKSFLVLSTDAAVVCWKV